MKNHGIYAFLGIALVMSVSAQARTQHTPNAHAFKDQHGKEFHRELMREYEKTGTLPATFPNGRSNLHLKGSH